MMPITPRRLAAAALVLLAAATARAEDPAKLLIELPPNVDTVQTGDDLRVQVVGVDADGVRMGFGGRTLVFTASQGTLKVVEAPFVYRYTAPKTIDAVTSVLLAAHLEGLADVKGSARIKVVPSGRFVRLVLRAPARTVSPGDQVALTILGELRDGKTASMGEARVKLSVEGGANDVGSVETQPSGRIVYHAPAARSRVPEGTKVRVVATLVANPAVTGTLELTIGAARKPVKTPKTPKPPEADPPKPPVDGEPGATPPAPTPEPETPKKDEEGGVLWSGKHARVLAWFGKLTAEHEWGKGTKKLPKAGVTFVRRGAFQRLRVRVEDTAARRATLQWWVGRRKGAKIHHEKGGDKGRFQVTRGKDRRLVCVLVGRVPEKGSVILRLLIEKGDGTSVHEDFVMRRGVDRNRDGVPDGRK